VDWSRTIHCIGDLHAGGVKRPRVSALLDDVKALPTPAFHLQIGDSTENGYAEEDVLAKRWLGRLPARHYTALGNHDLMGNKRTVKQWAAVHGYESQSYVIDFPTLRIIVVGPERDYPPARAGELSARTLKWLEARLHNAPEKTCWIACHWPLKNTVLNDEKGTLYDSTMLKFHAKPDDRIRALLAKYPNAKAWLSGHTHSPIDAPGLVTRAKLPGGKTIVSVNFSAIVGTGKKRDASDPVRSLYLTHFPGRMEIRFRDHGQRKWKHVGGRQVTHVKV
jgi:3',5'-cyclic AMP phosphodiesterase CpdA